MNAVRMVREVMGLNRELLLCGVSKKAWYYTGMSKFVIRI